MPGAEFQKYLEFKISLDALQLSMTDIWTISYSFDIYIKHMFLSLIKT